MLGYNHLFNYIRTIMVTIASRIPRNKNIGRRVVVNIAMIIAR